jgi:hypothetical protein
VQVRTAAEDACSGSPGGEQEQKDPPPEFHGSLLSPDAGGKRRQGIEKTDFELDAPRRAAMPGDPPERIIFTIPGYTGSA